MRTSKVYVVQILFLFSVLSEQHVFASDFLQETLLD